MEDARPATAADTARIVELARAARAAVAESRGGRLWEAADAPWEALQDRLAAALDGAPETAAWVGTIDDAVVGYAVAARRSLPDGGLLATLHELWVEPGAREVGVGERLLDQVLAWARAGGCRDLEARALPGDRATKNFFERAGLVARAIVVHRELGGA